jgi:hypothetical protein
MKARTAKSGASIRGAWAAVALSALYSGMGYCGDFNATLNPQKIEAHIFANLDPMFSKADGEAQTKILPLLKRSSLDFTVFGSLSNRAAGYVLSYLNTFGNVSQVSFRRNDEHADLVVIVDQDWSRHIDDYRIRVSRVVDVNYDEISNAVTPGAICQSFVYSKDGIVIDHAVVFISWGTRNYEFDRCLYRVILQAFGFKSQELPNRIISDEEAGERLLDLAALTVLYSLKPADRTTLKLRAAVHDTLEKSDQLQGR